MNKEHESLPFDALNQNPMKIYSKALKFLGKVKENLREKGGGVWGVK